MNENASDTINPCNLDTINERARQWAASGETIAEVDIEQLVIADDALDAIEDALRRHAGTGPIALVMDHTPMTRKGEPLKPLLLARLKRKFSVQAHTLPDDPAIAFHPTLAWCERLANELQSCACVVALGSGSICDVAKYARHLIEQQHRRRLPFVCLPTAASVTAYSSALAVITVDGAKRTLPARPPEAIICDLPTLAEAPPAMTAAGFADVLARSVAYGDWFLAHRLGMDDHFSLVPTRVLEPAESRMLALAEDVRDAGPDGVRAVTEALMLAGMAMSLVNQTAPISGWEHVISHFLDMTAERDQREHALHGAQVGVGALIAARAYDRLWSRLDLDRLAHDFPDDALPAVRQRIEEVYQPCDPSGRMVEEIWREMQRKLRRWQARRSERTRFASEARSGALRDELKQYIRPEPDIRRALTIVRAPLHWSDLDPPIPPTTATAAITHSHLIRERFTLGDLLDQAGALTAETARELSA